MCIEIATEETAAQQSQQAHSGWAKCRGALQQLRHKRRVGRVVQVMEQKM